MKVKETIAKAIAYRAEKIAYKNVGKSFTFGTHEVEPPKELLRRKRNNKK